MIFLSKLFVSQYRRTSQGHPSVLCFGKFPVAKKFVAMGEKGKYQDLPSNILGLTVPKYS